MSDSSNPFDDDAFYDGANPGYAPPPPPAPTMVAGRPVYLDGLNEEQLKAVETLDGPVLMLAGAGTGKTKALTTRIAHLLVAGKAWPRQILAVTFTNKASREMKDRVGALIGGVAEGMWLGTFHALAARMLRRHAELVGLKSNFTILDSDDQLRLLKQLMQAENIDTGRWPARALMGRIQRWKDRAQTPDKVSKGDAGDFANGRTQAIYAQYQERLKTLNAADFGDLMLHMTTIFQEHPDVLEDWRRRFKYVLVDEYQDTNVSQYLWLRLLAQEHKNICCVGDDDQSIYGWRGAEVGNILRFEKDFPGARVIRLERNYRSTGHILGAASGLIAKNEERLGKTLWTEADMGEPVQLRLLWDGDEEARMVGDEVENQQRKKVPLTEMAVLVRAGFQTRAFEERFVTLGLPYRVIGGPRFYERAEIRDALAYLRIVVQPDNDLAFERIVNTPKRGLGAATIQAAYTLARAKRISLFEASRQLSTTDELRPKARNGLGAVVQMFDRWRALSDGVDQVELLETVLDESGYVDMWRNDKSPEAPGRIESLRELVRAIGEFENLMGFLEHVSLVMENDQNAGDDVISIMTLHAAKGLEFDIVFLPGWEDGMFPNQRALDESGRAGLEEERRLAYVGLTRARRYAIISAAANRRVYNQWVSSLPSRFIDELPAEHIERDAPEGLGASYLQTPEFSGGQGMASGGYQSTKSRAMGARAAGPRAQVIDGVGFEVKARAKPKVDFAIGERVFHQKFGYGRVEDVDHDRLEIAFEQAGDKTVVASFVEKV
jgi:DNA helicase II / ATP-dependent DNA helicase PcrA